MDPEESKTAIAGQAYDPMQEAKTRVSGTSSDDVRAFLAAARPAELGASDSAAHQTLAAKTQVAPTSAEAVRAFIAAAPPADLAGESPSPMVLHTQVAPATAAEIAALTAAADKARHRDLFSAPAAPTRPGGKLEPANASLTVPAPSIPKPERPAMPAPADLPPPGGSAAPRPASSPSPAPAPAPHELPPPGGHAAPVNRRDTIMNAPAQPAALGGPARTAPPSAPPRAGYAPELDLDDAATMRMSVSDALGGVAPQHPHAQHPHAQESAVVSTQPQQQSPLGPPMAPIQHWQSASPQGVPAGHTLPMPMIDLDDEPLVVPGRNAKLIAMVVTVILGLAVGATVVWAFLLD